MVEKGGQEAEVNLDFEISASRKTEFITKRGGSFMGLLGRKGGKGVGGVAIDV